MESVAALGATLIQSHIISPTMGTSTSQDILNKVVDITKEWVRGNGANSMTVQNFMTSVDATLTKLYKDHQVL